MSIRRDLLRAAASGDADGVGKALLAGADPGVATKIGASALMLAAKFGCEECVRLLLPVSDALATDKNGDTALMSASKFPCCVALLLPFSEVHAENAIGFTALQFAAMNGEQESLRLLLEAADPAARTADGLAAAEVASDFGNESCSVFLKERTRELDAREEAGRIDASLKRPARQCAVQPRDNGERL